MKLAKLVITCLATITFLTSCDELKGAITVSSPINVVKDKKTYVIGVGTHQANLKVKNENLINFEVDTLSGEKDIKVKTNFNAKNLYNGQRIDLPSQVSGQPFDIVGIYKDETTNSENYNGWESCTYTERERQCGYVYYPPVCRTETICAPNGQQCHTREVCTGGGNRYECRDVDVTRYGQQEVSYYDSYRSREIALDIIVSGQKQGRVNASENTSDRIYTYKGFCR